MTIQTLLVDVTFKVVHGSPEEKLIVCWKIPLAYRSHAQVGKEQ